MQHSLKQLIKAILLIVAVNVPASAENITQGTIWNKFNASFSNDRKINSCFLQTLAVSEEPSISGKENVAILSMILIKESNPILLELAFSAGVKRLGSTSSEFEAIPTLYFKTSNSSTEKAKPISKEIKRFEGIGSKGNHQYFSYNIDDKEIAKLLNDMIEISPIPNQNNNAIVYKRQKNSRAITVPIDFLKEDGNNQSGSAYGNFVQCMFVLLSKKDNELNSR